MRRAIAMLFPLVLLLSTDVWGETGPEVRLTLEASVARALDQHPSMNLARAQFDQAGASRREAMAAWFPTLSASGSVMRYQEPSLVAPLHGFSLTNVPRFDETLLRGSLDLRWTIFDGGARAGRVRQSRRLLDAASGSNDRARQALMADVVAAYLRIIAEREILAAHDARIASFESQVDQTRQRREVGRAAEVEVLRLDAALASAKADQVNHQMALRTAENDLARLIGSDTLLASAAGLVPVNLLVTPTPDREAVVSAMRQSNPDLLVARSQMQAAEAARAVVRGSRWPELKATASYLDYGDSEGEHTTEWNAGVMLSWPLFTGGAISGAVARADAAARAARESVQLKDIEVRAAADRALAAIDEADARVGALQGAVASQSEVVRIERLSLDAGSGTQTDYLAAEAELLKAQAGLIEARHAAINARVALARLIGTLDEEWIHSNLENRP
ncbi:MAG: TolC family protein [Candidatus Zixiibacteriota bacterium]